MCQHLRRRHLAPAPLTLRRQVSQPGLYLIRHGRIEQVLHTHMPPLNENNQEPVSEGSFFCGSPIEYPIGAVSQTTLMRRAAQAIAGWASSQSLHRRTENMP